VSEQKNSLPLQAQQCADNLLEHINRIEDNIAEYDRILSRMAKADHRSQRVTELKGISPITACALVASIGRMDANSQSGSDLRHRSTAVAVNQSLAG